MNRIATQTPQRAATAAKPKPRPAATPTPSAGPTPAPMIVSSEDRMRMIAEAAYYRAMLRGFESGYELADWLDAEKEIDTRLQG